MSPNNGAEFQITRQTIEALDSWVDRLAAPLLPLERADSGAWLFQEETPLALLICKAVRMASGIHAAMMLADAGFVTECACLLRVVGDMATEVTSVVEGELSSQRTKAQQQFLDNFFSRPTMDVIAESAVPKKDFVSRDDLLKARMRFAEAAGFGGEKESVRDMAKKIFFGLDGYVHGSYSSGVELYHPLRRRFMMRGHEGEEARQSFRLAVGVKVHEVLEAFRLIAWMEKDIQLSADIRQAIARLQDSEEIGRVAS